MTARKGNTMLLLNDRPSANPSRQPIPALATTPPGLSDSVQHTPFPGTPPPDLRSKRASVLVQHLPSVPKARRMPLTRHYVL